MGPQQRMLAAESLSSAEGRVWVFPPVDRLGQMAVQIDPCSPTFARSAGKAMPGGLRGLVPGFGTR